ncbi:hypothetical protein ACFQ1M_18340 [Sungkyunkwania multivorans]|uniref:Phage protein n=1 Tax=Sungkyunkwania multivorans TaxID=1173618 RepID=A0ABW3D568_9FLAO
MYSILPHTMQGFKLSQDRVTRSYFSQVDIRVEKDKKTVHNTVATEFHLTHYGHDKERRPLYRWEVINRFLLNERGNIIKKLKKAQRIALMVATINDRLEFVVDKSFQLVAVTNTQEIRDKWREVRSELLDEFPDLVEMATDFDWQLKEENIQQVFLNDNFFTTLFSGFFDEGLEPKQIKHRNRIMANAVERIDIPMIETSTLMRGKSFSNDARIKVIGDFDIAHKKFPKAKLNTFLGDIAEKAGDKHTLTFDYNGQYIVKPEEGVIVKAAVTSCFKIDGLYQKTINITFNMEEDER